MKKQQGHLALQTIGIMGVDRGNGVTHLAIMMGNYLTAKLHKNTAIIEKNNSEAFSELKDSYGENANENQELNQFKISNVTYYYNIPNNKIGEIFSKNYEYIIIDMGTYKEKETEEFLKCNFMILIGTLDPWKNRKLIHSIERFLAYGNIEKIKYLVQSGTTDRVRQIKNVYQISMYAVPYEPDPFLIHGCNFEFLDQLLR